MILCIDEHNVYARSEKQRN